MVEVSFLVRYYYDTMTISKALLFSLLAVIGAMPVFVLVASATGTTVGEAQAQTMSFLTSWGGIAPAKLEAWIATVIGGGVGFALLVALAMAFDSLADASVHVFARPFRYFGKADTIWSEHHTTEWKNFRNAVRVAWGAENPSDDIAKDSTKWEAFKTARGKNKVRAPRTLVYFSLLLIIASGFDLFSETLRTRGILSLVLGVAGVIGFSFMWSDRKAGYVNEIVLANQTLKSPVPVPGSRPKEE